MLPTGRTFPPNTLTAYGVEDFRAHDAIGSAAHQRLESAMSSAPFMRRPVGSYDLSLLNVAGVNLLLAEPVDSALAGSFEPGQLNPYGPPWVSRLPLHPPGVEPLTPPDEPRPGVVPIVNGRAWPRAIFCMDAQQAPSDSEALVGAQRMATAPPMGSTLTRPWGPPDTVLVTPATTGSWVAPAPLWWIVERFWPGHAAPDLEREGPIRGGASWAAWTPRPYGPHSFGRLIHSPLRVTAAIEAPWQGWLVLLDQDFPGWRVTVDGKVARAARAFGLFRAVEVPAGRHEVVWEYRPLSFALGLALSLPAIAIAVVAGAVSALRRRR